MNKGEYIISKNGREIVSQLPREFQSEVHVGADYHSKRCFWCRKILCGKPTKDHIIPRSIGGKLTDGWVTCHQRCNSERGSRDFLKLFQVKYADFFNKNS